MNMNDNGMIRSYRTRKGGAWATGLGLLGLLITVAIIIWLVKIQTESMPSLQPGTPGGNPAKLIEQVREETGAWSAKNKNLEKAAENPPATPAAAPATPAAPAPAPVAPAPAAPAAAPIPAPSAASAQPASPVTTPPAPAAASPAPAPSTATTQPASAPAPAAAQPAGSAQPVPAGTVLGPPSPVSPVSPIVQESPGVSPQKAKAPAQGVNKGADDRNKALEDAIEKNQD